MSVIAARAISTCICLSLTKKHARRTLASFSSLAETAAERNKPNGGTNGKGLLLQSSSLPNQQQPSAADIAAQPAKTYSAFSLQQSSASTSTADHEQIEQFGNVDPSDWLDEQNGAFKALHSFNKVRVPWILAHLGKVSHL
jgi:hypothetical protein